MIVYISACLTCMQGSPNSTSFVLQIITNSLPNGFMT